MLRGTEKYTKIIKGAHDGVTTSEYIVKSVETGDILSEVYFQTGPIKEYGINGINHEDLINMVVDRLEDFQESPFCCTDNDRAITKFKEGLFWLRQRTEDRERRSVIGTSKI